MKNKLMQKTLLLILCMIVFVGCAPGGIPRTNPTTPTLVEDTNLANYFNLPTYYEEDTVNGGEKYGVATSFNLESKKYLMIILTAKKEIDLTTLTFKLSGITNDKFAYSFAAVAPTFVLDGSTKNAENGKLSINLSSSTIKTLPKDGKIQLSFAATNHGPQLSFAIEFLSYSYYK